MTEASTADRLAALEARRRRPDGQNRRRPAEASRILATGAGSAALLTMVTAMAHADQVVEVVETPFVEGSVIEGSMVPVPATFETVPATTPQVTQAPVTQPPVVQTITVARPARTQIANARTSASR